MPEKQTATEVMMLEAERRQRMAKAISFVMMGTEDRWPDWEATAVHFIKQLQYELVSRKAGRMFGNQADIIIQDDPFKDIPRAQLKFEEDE